MDRKPKISAEATYVFNEGELDQLDELSLTSVIAAATDSLEQAQTDCDGDAPGPGELASIPIEGDGTINELLDGPAWSRDRHSDPEVHSPVRTARGGSDPSDDLLAPELLWPAGNSDEKPS